MAKCNNIIGLFHPESTKKILIAIADIFNKVQIEQIDGTISSIPIYVSSAEKLIVRLSKNRTTSITAPAIGIEVTSLDMDEERILNPIKKILGDAQYVLNPVAYNWTVDISIVASRESMLFDIIENIVPNFVKSRRYPLIDFRFKDGTYIQRDIDIELSAIPIDISSIDIGEEDEQSFKTTLTFIIRGWIYGSNPTLLTYECEDNLYIAITDPDIGDKPGIYSGWELISEFSETGIQYNIGSYTVFNGTLYRSLIDNNDTIPEETGNEWEKLYPITDYPTWRNDINYSIDDIVRYVGNTGIIEWIDINFKNMNNKKYEQLLIQKEPDGTISNNII